MDFTVQNFIWKPLSVYSKKLMRNYLEVNIVLEVTTENMEKCDNWNGQICMENIHISLKSN